MELAYRDVLEHFERLWTNPNLPSDTRLVTCGAVQAAGRKQGEEVFREEIMEGIAAGNPDLEESDFEHMVESVHEFVLVKKRLRHQYLAIVLKVMTKHLSANYQHLASDFQTRLAEAAARN